MSTKVSLSYSYERSMEELIWAKTNCPSYITNTIHHEVTGPIVSYFFVNEKDAAWFILRWV